MVVLVAIAQSLSLFKWLSASLAGSNTCKQKDSLITTQCQKFCVIVFDSNNSRKVRGGTGDYHQKNFVSKQLGRLVFFIILKKIGE
jgi:hypothetical protein